MPSNQPGIEFEGAKPRFDKQEIEGWLFGVRSGAVADAERAQDRSQYMTSDALVSLLLQEAEAAFPAEFRMFVRDTIGFELCRPINDAEVKRNVGLMEKQVKALGIIDRNYDLAEGLADFDEEALCTTTREVLEGGRKFDYGRDFLGNISNQAARAIVFSSSMGEHGFRYKRCDVVADLHEEVRTALIELVREVNVGQIVSLDIPVVVDNRLTVDFMDVLRICREGKTYAGNSAALEAQMVQDLIDFVSRGGKFDIHLGRLEVRGGNVNFIVDRDAMEKDMGCYRNLDDEGWELVD